MHRDLKPQNIMLDENFNVKVIDFGDARKVDEPTDDDEDEEPAELNDDSRFAEGPDMHRRDTFVGTVNYMSPEVIDGGPQGVAVDTWAIGNILFRCLYGTVAFKGVNPEKVYDDIRHRRIHWPPDEIID